MKVLVARTDKLGDVVLALPVLAWLRARRPEWELHALVAPGSVPLVENDPAVARVWTWDAGAGRPAAAALQAELAGARFDAALLLYYEPALARLLGRLGVSPRVGPLSKWTSWLLLDRGVWQRRSRGGRHESDYNLRLARALARVADDGGEAVPRLHLSAAQRERGRRFREVEAGGADTVAFVHPGSGGSALNWPPERFGQVAAQLATGGWRVFITGGPDDAEAASRAADAAGAAGGGVQSLAGRWDLREFLGVLSGGDVLVGPSTGPLHMAAALGLAVAGVYSPLPVQGVGRWGPRGPRACAVAPELRCPARLTCRLERCRHWNCLERIAVADVVALARAARTAPGRERV